jgi:hypothetical protein
MRFESKQIKKAWKIRKDAAEKFACHVMEISWAACLKIAMEENMERMEIAEKIAEEQNGRVWAPKGDEGIIRVYLRKGFCQVENDGVNIDSVGGYLFESVRDYVKSMGVEAYRR